MMIHGNSIFHHVGIATVELAAEIELYKGLGYELESQFTDTKLDVRGAFLRRDGFRVELLESLSAKSPISSWVRRGVHMYHQAYVVEDFQEVCRSLEKAGANRVHGPVVSVAFNGALIAFFMFRNSLVLEVVDGSHAD